MIKKMIKKMINKTNKKREGGYKGK